MLTYRKEEIYELASEAFAAVEKNDLARIIKIMAHIESDNSEDIKKLLTKPNECGNTLISVAAKNKQWEILDWLLEKIISLKKISAFFDKADDHLELGKVLILALKSRNFTTPQEGYDHISLLLQNGAKTRYVFERNKNNIAHLIARKGDPYVNLVPLLIKEDLLCKDPAYILMTENKRHLLPFQIAANNNSPQLVSALLDPNHITQSNISYFIRDHLSFSDFILSVKRTAKRAISENKFAILKALIDSFFNRNEIFDFDVVKIKAIGHDLIRYATLWQQWEMIDYLMQNFIKKYPSTSCHHNDILKNAYQAMLESPENTSVFRNFCLEMISSNIISLNYVLLENLCLRKKWDAFDDVFDLLIKKYPTRQEDSKINIRRKILSDALFLMVKSKERSASELLKFITKLTKHKAKPLLLSKDENGNNVFHFIAEYGEEYKEFLYLLIENYYDKKINFINKKNEYPSEIARNNGNELFAKILFSPIESLDKLFFDKMMESPIAEIFINYFSLIKNNITLQEENLPWLLTYEKLFKNEFFNRYTRSDETDALFFIRQGLVDFSNSYARTLLRLRCAAETYQKKSSYFSSDESKHFIETINQTLSSVTISQTLDPQRKEEMEAKIQTARIALILLLNQDTPLFNKPSNVLLILLKYSLVAKIMEPIEVKSVEMGANTIQAETAPMITTTPQRLFGSLFGKKDKKQEAHKKLYLQYQPTF